jgi:cyclomaltodextrinase
LLSFYPRENAYAMYNLLGTHDTERILTHLGNHEEKTKLAYMLQFAYPGAPAIYYGDEIGLVGGKDPACRGAFLWEQPSWNMGLQRFIKDLVRLRKEHVALRRGEYVRIPIEPSTNIYAFLRTSQEDKVLVIMNAGGTAADININIERCGWQDGQVIKDLLSPERVFSVMNRSLTIRLPAWNGLWLG